MIPSEVLLPWLLFELFKLSSHATNELQLLLAGLSINVLRNFFLFFSNSNEASFALFPVFRFREFPCFRLPVYFQYFRFCFKEMNLRDTQEPGQCFYVDCAEVFGQLPSHLFAVVSLEALQESEQLLVVFACLSCGWNGLGDFLVVVLDHVGRDSVNWEQPSTFAFLIWLFWTKSPEINKGAHFDDTGRRLQRNLQAIACEFIKYANKWMQWILSPSIW